MTQPLTLETRPVGAQAYDMSLSCLCSYCGQPGAMFGPSDGEPANCVLCHLVRHLERPWIDEEASLIWLPEMDQRILNVICRAMHLALHAAHQPLDDEAPRRGDAADLAQIHYAQQALRQRTEHAAIRLGTDRPSELAEALTALPRRARARQPDLLGGLRLLPRGRFFAGDEDVYPSILGAWRGVVSNAGAA